MSRIDKLMDMSQYTLTTFKALYIPMDAVFLDNAQVYNLIGDLDE